MLLPVLIGSGALGWAQGVWGSRESKNWAWDQAKSWYVIKRDPDGQRRWDNRKFGSLAYGEQTTQLLEHLGNSGRERRAALIILGDRALDSWARQALRKAGDRDEVAHFLYLKGYRMPGKDPYAYLEPGARLDRPWTHGLGIHLDQTDAWRLQWIPSPVLMSRIEAPQVLPKALERAPQPGVLLHLQHLRPGVERLKGLAGGEGGVSAALAQGTRAGFLLRHMEVWLKKADPALAPLADREAWVLHYGLRRDDFGPSEGTLIFLPGDLPTRTQLALDLLRLNPLSRGARSRSVDWNGVKVTQVRGSGGVLNLASTPEGTWISDREAPLRDLLFPVAQTTLGDRREWCRVALAAMHPDTQVSLWVLPRIGAGAAFERQAIRRELTGATQGVWPNPYIAKAAPRTGALALSMGAGPTELLIGSLLRTDDPGAIDEPRMPAFAEEGRALTADQKKAYQAEVLGVRRRREDRKLLRAELSALAGSLDLRGASIFWNGWVEAPALSAEQKAAMTRFNSLKKEDRWRANEKQRLGKAGYFGGYGEPGMAPSIAVSIALKPGQQGKVQGDLARILPRLFKGRHQKRVFSGVEIQRIRTDQAFAPSYAVVNDTLVLGSDDASVQAVVAGLLGQAPTLADYETRSFARAELDGPKVASALETLLLSYLRSRSGGSSWWWLEGPADADEAGAEVASTFGPFLGAIRALGRRGMELEWGPWGLEGRPR
nr:hypothetical protein [uncultured Holophaga sp.]